MTRRDILRARLAIVAANLGAGIILAMGVVIIMAAATRWWSAIALAALIIAHLWWSDRGSR